jgi:hypothetical protein
MGADVEDRGQLPVRLTRAVLDTYLNTAVGLVGCRSRGLGRRGCEYDLLIVGHEARPSISLKMGQEYADLYFVTEEEALKPADPELAVSLAYVRYVRDSSWVLSTASSACRAMLSERSRQSAEGRLASSLKMLGRADEAISVGSTVDADFWLLSASYEFALAWLYGDETPPSPSHLLAQLKETQSRSARRFVAFSRAAGLEQASRGACEARLEGLSVLFDIADTPKEESADRLPATTRARFDIVKRKAQDMLSAMQPVDCYSFLGHVVCTVFPSLQVQRKGERRKDRDAAMIVTGIAGEGRLLSERVVRQLGLVRSDRTVRRGIDALRDEVTRLAKSI